MNFETVFLRVSFQWAIIQQAVFENSKAPEKSTPSTVKAVVHLLVDIVLSETTLAKAVSQKETLENGSRASIFSMTARSQLQMKTLFQIFDRKFGRERRLPKNVRK